MSLQLIRLRKVIGFLNREEPQILTVTKEIFPTSNKISMSATHQPNKKNQSSKLNTNQKEN